MTDHVPARRNSWAVPAMAALLVGVPIAEVWLLLSVGRQIGALPTLALLMVIAALGAWLMKREGSRAWASLKQALGRGSMPSRELTDAALVLVGGILLLLPGFFTDVVGLVFLLPFTRPLARSMVAFFASKQVAKVTVETDLARARSNPGMTVEGEVVNDETAPGQARGGSSVRVEDAREITGEVI